MQHDVVLDPVAVTNNMQHGTNVSSQVVRWDRFNLFPDVVTSAQSQEVHTAPLPTDGRNKKKRRVIPVCYNCHVSKVKCDRKMPACSRCVDGGKDCYPRERAGYRTLSRTRKTGGKAVDEIERPRVGSGGDGSDTSREDFRHTPLPPLHPVMPLYNAQIIPPSPAPSISICSNGSTFGGAGAELVCTSLTSQLSPCGPALPNSDFALFHQEGTNSRLVGSRSDYVAQEQQRWTDGQPYTSLCPATPLGFSYNWRPSSAQGLWDQHRSKINAWSFASSIQISHPRNGIGIEDLILSPTRGVLDTCTAFARWASAKMELVRRFARGAIWSLSGVKTACYSKVFNAIRHEIGFAHKVGNPVLMNGALQLAREVGTMLQLHEQPRSARLEKRADGEAMRPGESDEEGLTKLSSRELLLALMPSVHRQGGTQLVQEQRAEPVVDVSIGDAFVKAVTMGAFEEVDNYHAVEYQRHLRAINFHRLPGDVKKYPTPKEGGGGSNEPTKGVKRKLDGEVEGDRGRDASASSSGLVDSINGGFAPAAYNRGEKRAEEGEEVAVTITLVRNGAYFTIVNAVMCSWMGMSVSDLQPLPPHLTELYGDFETELYMVPQAGREGATTWTIMPFCDSGEKVDEIARGLESFQLLVPADTVVPYTNDTMRMVRESLVPVHIEGTIFTRGTCADLLYRFTRRSLPPAAGSDAMHAAGPDASTAANACAVTDKGKGLVQEGVLNAVGGVVDCPAGSQEQATLKEQRSDNALDQPYVELEQGIGDSGLNLGDDGLLLNDPACRRLSGEFGDLLDEVLDDLIEWGDAGTI